LIGDRLVAEVVFRPLRGFVRVLGHHTFVSRIHPTRPRRQVGGASADHRRLAVTSELERRGVIAELASSNRVTRWAYSQTEGAGGVDLVAS